MALTSEEIAHHQYLLDFYERESDKAEEAMHAAKKRRDSYDRAIRNTKTILRGEGVAV